MASPGKVCSYFAHISMYIYPPVFHFSDISVSSQISLFSTGGQYALLREVHHNPRFGVGLCGRERCVCTRKIEYTWRTQPHYQSIHTVTQQRLSARPAEKPVLWHQLLRKDRALLWGGLARRQETRLKSLFLIKGLGSGKNGQVVCGSSGWQASALDFPG